MTYPEWIAGSDTLASKELDALRREVAGLAEQPLISVLMPVYNPDFKFLEDAIDSVRGQIYPNWELCVAEDHSTDEEVRSFLENMAGRDSRLKIFFRAKNGGIALCSNSALALARGEWCALLDQDDLLAENALAEVVREIDRQPEAGSSIPMKIFSIRQARAPTRSSSRIGTRAFSLAELPQSPRSLSHQPPA